MAAGSVVTVPFCGTCGWDPTNDIFSNLNQDVFCDSCGADLNRFGFAGLFPPLDLAASGGVLSVTFTWTAAIDTQDLLVQRATGPLAIVTGANAAGEVVVGIAGEKITGRIRTVLGGVEGPWSSPIADAVNP